MKILNVNKFYYMQGGSERYYFSLQNLLEENNHKVMAFSMQHKSNLDTPFSKYFVTNIDYTTKSLRKKIRFSSKIIYSFEAKRKIAKIIDAEKPDIAHLHIFQHQLSASILPQLKKKGIPIVYTVHDYKPLCPNYKMLSKGKPCEKCISGRFYNCLFNKCSKDSYTASLVNTIEMYFHRIRKYYDLIDVFVAPSKFLRKKMIDSGFDESKVIHIPNFVERKEFSSSNGHKPYLLYFGRLSEEKGILTMLKAMEDVEHSRLLIVGRGPLEEKIKKMVSDSKSKNIELIGFKSGKDLEKVIHGSMFTVLPSKCFENNPFSILESFAYGRAVVGAKIGGIPELVKDGANGLLFEPGDPKDLAVKINKMVDNKQTTKKMGLSAQGMINDLYSPQAHYERLIEIYEGLVA